MGSLKKINEFFTGERDELNFAIIQNDTDTGLWHYCRYLTNTKEDTNKVFTTSEQTAEWHKQRFCDNKFIILSEET